MFAKKSKNTFCSSCGRAVDYVFEKDGKDFVCCCGGRCRTLSGEANISLKVSFYYKYRYLMKKVKGIKRSPYEEVNGYDFSRSKGKFVLLIRIFDRLKDRYFEKVEDSSTGEVIHLKEEKLSEHRGHGSDKKQ